MKPSSMKDSVGTKTPAIIDASIEGSIVYSMASITIFFPLEPVHPNRVKAEDTPVSEQLPLLHSVPSRLIYEMTGVKKTC